MQPKEHETPPRQQQQDPQLHQRHYRGPTMESQQQQQSSYVPSSSYDTSMHTAPIQSQHYHQPPIQQYPQPHQQYQPSPSYPPPPPAVYTTPHQPQQMGAYNLKAPPALDFTAASVALEERATRLLAACESCLVVTRIPGVDMSFRRIMDRKCPRCSGTLVLPQEGMEMLILYGNFVPESVAVTLVLSMMVLPPTLRPDFMAAAMNELLSPLQTDFVYDVAVPKRPEGLGMSLRMNQGNLVVGGFIDFENNSESPSVAARIIAVNDVLVAINKKYITSWSFEKSISMLAHAASPVYLTFRRRHAVMLL